MSYILPRKKRKGEFVCDCPAYKFPHRFGGGKCTGFKVVSDHWSTYFGHCDDCQSCNSLDGAVCQVMQGVERETECQVFQEFIDYEEIRLLGSYWK